MPKSDYELVAEPRPNMVEIDRILDYIIDHQDEWDQSSWFNPYPAQDDLCGTTLCFAGHAVVAAGYVFEPGGGDAGWTLVDPGGWPVRYGVGYEASKLLGLNGQEQDDLFLNTIRPTKERALEAVKVTVEKIRHRAKLQDQAFNRLAQEFIDAAGLDTIDLEHCPDSPEIVKGLRGGEQK